MKRPTAVPFVSALAIAAAFVLGLLPSRSSAQMTGADDPRARKVDALFAEYDRPGTPGLAVAVVRDGRVLLRKGYGRANLEFDVPITPSTVFDMASVSKQFAGFAVATLIEEGKVRLSDDIRKYIPELPQFGPTITVDHLVHHASGLRDWPGTLAIAGWRMDDVISFDQILDMAYHQKELNFTPGAEYIYSNTGYNVLAEMVARVTGQSFRKWTDERIFRPLAMADTHFQDDHTELIRNRAFGYGRGEDGAFRCVTDNLTALGSSSLFSTADDMAKWLLNFDDAKVGGPAVRDRMRTAGVLNDGKRNSYAYGLVLGGYRGLPAINHSGQWAAFSTFVEFFPEQRFGVVVLANSREINAASAANKVVDIYLDQEIGRASGKPTTDAAVKPVAAAAKVELAPAALDAYAGLYKLGPGWYVRVRRDGNALKAQASGEDEAPMTARSDSEFWVDAYGASVVFQRDASGKVASFLYRGKTAPKLDSEPAPAISKLPDYAGVYVSDELLTSYTVEVKDGALVMRHRRHGTIKLTHLYGEDFGGSEWFLGSVEFRRDAAGKVTGFVVNAESRVRNVRFEKRG